MKEIIWKDVVGFEGLYSISEYGIIKSHHRSGCILKPKKDRDGYFGVTLSKEGKAHHLRVHRLVALAFLPNPDNHPIVNHKDLNVQNNHHSNLEWCTNFYNIKHYLANGYGKRVLSSLDADELNQIVSMYHSGMSQKDIALHFNLECRADAVSEVVTGRRFSELTGIQVSANFQQRTTEKISDEDVMNILDLYHNHKTSQKTLCETYQLSPAQLSRIVNGSRRTSVYNSFFNQAASS
jgi:hypothetical protein